MSKLTELKKIAAARTPGEWFWLSGGAAMISTVKGKPVVITGAETCDNETGLLRPLCGSDNGEVIAAAVNNFDQLIAVVEAAHELENSILGTTVDARIALIDLPRLQKALAPFREDSND